MTRNLDRTQRATVMREIFFENLKILHTTITTAQQQHNNTTTSQHHSIHRSGWQATKKGFKPCYHDGILHIPEQINSLMVLYINLDETTIMFDQYRGNAPSRNLRLIMTFLTQRFFYRITSRTKLCS